jgi:hypothetical protein
MVSLIELIQKGKVPLHQFMDLETVNWIKKNKPSFNINNPPEYIFKKQIEYFLGEIKKYIPDPNWFLILEKKDSIHGMRHILRVIFHSLFLTILNKDLSTHSLKNTLVASSLHDLKRKNDLMDLFHGKRVARWFKKNISLIENHYEIHLSQRDIDEIYFAISFHDVPYKKIEENTNYNKNKILTDILKTADALDRYRLPSLRLWFKDKFISFIPPEYLKYVAFELVISSEINFLKGHSNENSVLMAIKEVFQ